MFKNKKKTTIVLSRACWYELYKLKEEPSVSMEDVIRKLLEERKCR